MKFVALFVAFLLSFAARAEDVGLDLSGTSPAGASATVLGTPAATRVAPFSTCSIYIVAQGGTGGTLDIFLQTSFKSRAGEVWVDVAHLPQIAAAAAAASFVFSITRWSNAAPTINATTNVVSGTPLLPVNTVLPGLLGNQLRVVYKTGAGNSAGAAQVILAECSAT